MNLSFIILTWNSEKYLERCVSSVMHALDDSGLSYEILIFDNGSRDRTPDLLARLAERSDGRLIACFGDTNIGTTRSRNRLFQLAQGECLCVMDSDVELASGVIESMMPMLEQDRDLGIVVPRINYPSGTWQKSFDRFPTVATKIKRLFWLREMEGHEGQAFQGREEPFYVDYAISAFWLMRRDLLQAVGLLDERIFYAPEDVDFCLRVWKAGRRILYVPYLAVVHHTQEISRGAKLNRAKVSHIRGLAYYFLKHRYCVRAPEFRSTLTRG